MNVQVDTAYLLKGLKEYFKTKQLCEIAGGVVKFPVQPAKAVSLLIEAIAVVEKLVADASVVGAGGIKREALVKFFDKAIALPWWAEKVDNWIIGWAVDGLVGWFNDNAGRYWLGKSVPLPKIRLREDKFPKISDPGKTMYPPDYMEKEK